ncbi:Ribose operon repressor [Pontiella desulfatans]|uniref:Ribose operon repressor n=1 Tax=Pontiella desulfatans TaxID=2750659 RepID=A0A6C2U5I9_PONDE|nr:LacI family DNA-binding transcriptional regulator [Pontiella desulfatans]VGO15338.1 Ribose operon repressor [Pontiella desulfatans]
MASIVDVAKLANVSVATVSRILNDERNVTPETTKLVEVAIKELGYVPKAVRPGPKPKNRKGITTGTIAFISVGSFSPVDMYRMPAFPSLLGGIQRGIERHGMELVLAHLPEGKAVPPVLARRRADGVLLFGFETLSTQLKRALNRVPAVWCFLRDSVAPSTDFDHVLYDNSHVGRMAADYLLGRKHRNLMFVGSRPNHQAFAERRDQFVALVAAGGGTAKVVEGIAKNDDALTPSRLEEIAQRAVAGLGDGAARTTGIFVSSDDLMVRVYNQLKQHGVEPGKDVDLIGCNNDKQYMDQMHPRPATVDIKLDLVGERAVEQLLWRMSHPGDIAQAQLLIKPEVLPAGKPAGKVPLCSGLP